MGCWPCVALLALAGCANAEPGVVAYVGDDRITQGQFDRAVAGVTTTLEEGQQVSRDAVVNAMIHGALAEQIAADRNITLTDAEREAVSRPVTWPSCSPSPTPGRSPTMSPTSRSWRRTLGAEAYLAAVREQPVTLNPRFGVLDPEQKLIIGEQTGSLSKPAPAPTPNP